jgi:hypothetical protein
LHFKPHILWYRMRKRLAHTKLRDGLRIR